jgi:cation:H+ antiporter
LIGLLAGALYSFVIVIKGSLTLLDSFFLLLIYGTYITLLLKLPSKDEANIHELEVVPRYILTRKPWFRNTLIWSCFIIGGVGIFVIAEPFLESAMGLSVVLGVPAFMVIQWLAPFLSEFPEKVSAFYWAKSITKAPMALMNMTSSAIAELTLLISIIPIVFCIAMGRIDEIPFDWAHRAEIMLTGTQAILGFVMLSNMNFKWYEALWLLILWASQIFFQYEAGHITVPLIQMPELNARLWDFLHGWILAYYTAFYWFWIGLEFTAFMIIYKKLPVFCHFANLLNAHLKKGK